MDGMGMMFKALGLDPEVILKSAEEFKQGLAKLNADLETIKRQQAEILYIIREAKHLEIIMPNCPGEETAGIPPHLREINHG